MELFTVKNFWPAVVKSQISPEFGLYSSQGYVGIGGWCIITFHMLIMSVISAINCLAPYTKCWNVALATTPTLEWKEQKIFSWKIYGSPPGTQVVIRIHRIISENRAVPNYYILHRFSRVITVASKYWLNSLRDVYDRLKPSRNFKIWSPYVRV